MNISGIYRITNTITGDFYIGSSKNVKQRWANHKCKSTWNKCPNNPMYIDMKKYGLDNFVFEILAEVEEDSLKETEQQFIETLKPTYNNRNANGLDFERKKEYNKEYQKSDKYKEYEKTEKRKKAKKEYQKEYQKTDKFKEYQKSEKYKKYQKEYQQSDERKEYQKEYYKEYGNQLCCYNGEILTLYALSKRFQRAGIPHPQIEAKKYLLNK